MRWLAPRARGPGFASRQSSSNAGSTRRSIESSALRRAERVPEGTGVTLAPIGPSGVGKCHLMYAAIRRLNERGLNAGARGWSDLTPTLRAAKFSGGEEESHPKALDEREKRFRVQAFEMDEMRPTAVAVSGPDCRNPRRLQAGR